MPQIHCTQRSFNEFRSSGLLVVHTGIIQTMRPKACQDNITQTLVPWTGGPSSHAMNAKF